MPDFIEEKRATPSIAEEVSLIGANQKIMQQNVNNYIEDINKRLDEHSMELRHIHNSFAKLSAALQAQVSAMKLAENRATREELRAVERHTELLEMIQRGIDAYNVLTMRVSDIDKKHSDSTKAGEAALKDHAKNEPLLTKMVIASWGAVALLLALLWSFASDKIKAALELMTQ